MRNLVDTGIPWLGKIPDSWSCVHLKRVATIITGSTPDRKREEYFSKTEGIPWIKPENLGNLNPINSADEYLTPEGQNVGKIFPPLTIYVCCIASVGKVGFSDIPCSCNQQINAILFNEKIVNKQYGYYVLQAATLEHEAIANESVQKIVNTTSEGYIKIPVTPYEEQITIVNFLNNRLKQIAESIQGHQSIIEKLEKYKVSVITQAVTKGIKQNVEMKESNEIWIGKVPSNWRLWKLKYTVNLRKEKCINRPYIGLENVESRSACFLGYGECDSEALLVKPGDVIFSKLRPYLSKTLLVNEEASCNSEFLVMTPLLFESEYLKYVTLSSSFVDRVNGSSYGVKMPRASWNFVGNLIVPLPSREEQRAIVSYLNNICSEIDQAKNKALEVITKLEKYRQSLIYSAVTGKISCTGGAL